MDGIKVQYINEYREKKNTNSLTFIVLVSLGFLVMVGALCSVLWVIT